jgi:capsular exopolysaccharide synthesis family protein
VLTLVPTVDSWRDRAQTELVSQSKPKSPAAEAYRTLRTSVQFVGLERTMQVLQVTSPVAAEGKTTTLANLGVALARAGKRVVMVDWDLRRPRIESFFGVDNSFGFTNVVVGDASLADAVQAVPGEPGLAVLPSGPTPPNPSELLSTRRAADILRALADAADYVLVDCPPVLPVTDAIIVSGIVDATMLVVTAGSTTKRQTGRAVELLRQIDAPLVGAVLNGVGSGGRGYGYGYGYEYGYDSEPKSRRKMSRPRLRRRRQVARPPASESEPAEASW